MWKSTAPLTVVESQSYACNVYQKRAVFKNYPAMQKKVFLTGANNNTSNENISEKIWIKIDLKLKQINITWTFKNMCIEYDWASSAKWKKVALFLNTK